MFFTTYLLCPLVCFLVLFFGGRWLGRKGSFLFASVLLWANLVIVLAWLGVLYQKAWGLFFLGSWISTPALTVSWNFMVDPLAVVMLLLINLIGLIVVIYSEEYMNQDPYVIKFLSYICLFIFFMVMLVCSTNLLHFFFAWEGVGLCSFLLISFGHTRILAIQAALKAVTINRISDCAFLLAILWLYAIFGMLDFPLLACLVPHFASLTTVGGGYEVPVLAAVGALLVVGAFGKSAQLGLHIWLPEAMEGPTPISALIHAATMVTLGIFLVMRTSFLLETVPEILAGMVVLSSISLFVTSLFGAVQYDMKKIIAYSTCSQLGYMFLACGVSQYGPALFHLMNHGFFKALLFLCAGNVIHAMNNQQDIRKMGGLVRVLPLTSMFFLLGSLSLMGVPATSGYYSKDLIVELVLFSSSPFHVGAYALALVSVLLTAYYSTKTLYYVFYAPPAGSATVYRQATETINPLVVGSLTLLAVLSLISGSGLKHLLVDSSFLDVSVVTSYEAHQAALWGEIWKETGAGSVGALYLPLIGAGAGFGLGLFLCGGVTAYRTYMLARATDPAVALATGEQTGGQRMLCLGRSSWWTAFYPLYVFVARKGYFDQAYNSVAAGVLARVTLSLFRTVERGVFEMFGPRGVFEGFVALYYRAVRARSPFLLGVLGFLIVAGVGIYIWCVVTFLG